MKGNFIITFFLTILTFSSVFAQETVKTPDYFFGVPYNTVDSLVKQNIINNVNVIMIANQCQVVMIEMVYASISAIALSKTLHITIGKDTSEILANIITTSDSEHVRLEKEMKLVRSNLTELLNDEEYWDNFETSYYLTYKDKTAANRFKSNNFPEIKLIDQAFSFASNISDGAEKCLTAFDKAIQKLKEDSPK